MAQMASEQIADYVGADVLVCALASTRRADAG
jgi:hypothetical protein